MSQPTLEPQLSRKEAKAQAAAAKAYAKARGNWFMRHKILTALGALVLIIIIAMVASGGGSSSSNATHGGGHHAQAAQGHTGSTKAGTKSSDSGTSVQGSSAYGSAKFPMQNGDWRLDSIQVKNDGLGDFGGTARVTYTGSDKSGGDNIFTITLFRGKNVVATYDGGANSVQPGTTVTVSLVSSDKYVAGPYKFDFQNDL